MTGFIFTLNSSFEKYIERKRLEAGLVSLPGLEDLCGLVWNHRTVPRRILSQACSCDSGLGFTPSLAHGSPGAAAIEVQQPFAKRVEVKEEWHQLAIQGPERSGATDQLVVINPAVSEAHGSVYLHLHSLSMR